MLAHRVKFEATHGAACVVRLFGRGDRDSAAMAAAEWFPGAKLGEVEAIEHDAPRVWNEQDAAPVAQALDWIAGR